VLLELLAKADLARAKRATLPICEGLLLEARKGTLSVTGYDLETRVIATGEAEVQRKGAVVAPAELISFLKGAKGDTVCLQARKKTLKAKVDSLTATFEGFEREDYPPTLPAKGKQIKVMGLAEALSEVVFCAAKEDNRPVLCGVNFRPADWGAKLATADGFRLAVTPLAMQGKLAEEFILPRKSAEVAARLFKGDAWLRIVPRNSTRDIFIEADGVTLRAGAISGSYLNIDQLIPKDGKAIKFDPTRLLEAVKAVEPMAKKGSGIVRLQVRQGKIKVSAKADDVGSMEAEVPTSTKRAAKIAFNLQYLKEALAKLGPDATMRVTQPSSPAVLRNKSSKTIQVIMPMFVQW
jgi:DNA polymerase-3 subunit beta